MLAKFRDRILKAEINELDSIICDSSEYFRTLKDLDRSEIAQENIYPMGFIDAVFKNKRFNELVIAVIPKDGRSISHAEEIEEDIVRKRDIRKFLELGSSLLAYLVANRKIDPAFQYRQTSEEILKGFTKQFLFDFSFQRVNFALIHYLSSKEYYYDVIFHRKVISPFLYNSLQKSNLIMRAILLTITQHNILSECFFRITPEIEQEATPSLRESLNKVYGVSAKIETGLTNLERLWDSKTNDSVGCMMHFVRSIRESNEIILGSILCAMTSGFAKEDGSFTSCISRKIECVNETQESILQAAHSELGAFLYAEIIARGEWANKVFLLSIKTLAVFNAIAFAKNITWRNKVAFRELHKWLVDVHQIINRSYLLDDWQIIESSLIQESTTVEWKGSFIIPLTGINLHTKDKTMMHKIADTILSMMNTKGGVILVGYVENPKTITAKDILEHIVKKNGHYFFDVQKEMEIHNHSPDLIRRELQDILVKLAECTISDIDGYWELEELRFQHLKKTVTCFRVKVEKLPVPIFSVELEKLTIRTRVNGRNENLDPRKRYDLKLRL